MQALLDRKHSEGIIQSQHKEFSARSALRKHHSDLAKARCLAESQFRTFVGRDLSVKEIAELHLLISEVHKWQTGEASNAA